MKDLVMADDTGNAVCELLRDIRAKMEISDAKLGALDAGLRNLGDSLDDPHDAGIISPSRARGGRSRDPDLLGVDETGARLRKILGNGKLK